MEDLRELYQETILDHNRNPRNFRKIARPAGGQAQPAGDQERDVRHAEGVNPLCGDKVDVYLALDGDTVRDVSFEGAGCAISTASASVMTEMLKGKSRVEAEKLFSAFHGMLTGNAAPDVESIGKLAVFARVGDFPMRVKCATLAWHTMQAALRGDKGSVSTE